MIDHGVTCKVARKMSDERICWNNFDKMFLFSKPLMRPKGLFTCLLRKALLAKFFGEKKNQTKLEQYLKVQTSYLHLLHNGWPHPNLMI